MTEAVILQRMAASIYVNAWCHWSWEDLRAAMEEQDADELLRMGNWGLERHVAVMMSDWERRQFERDAVAAGEHSALVAGVL